MADQDIVHIAASAVRDRETGHVFCAAILSWPAGQNERVFLRDILSGSGDGSSYINTSAGLAHIVSVAMGRLSRRCSVKVQIDVAPTEFMKFMELTNGSRKPTAHEAKLLQEMHRTRDMFSKLAASIEQRTLSNGLRFSVVKASDDDAVCEVRSYASAYRDGWPSRNITSQTAERYPSPSP